MQTQNKCFIGIDVSKSWFDLSMIIVTENGKQGMITEKFDNTTSGLTAMTQWLKVYKVPMNDSTLVVIENTGVYHRLIWEYCNKKNLSLHIGNAAHIKWSLGITRGKDDITDSQRLCSYCYRHSDELKATPGLDPVILQLKDLMTARTRLKAQINSTKVYLKELKQSNSKEVQNAMEKAHKAALDGMAKSLLIIEKQINKIASEHKEIKNNYELLLSVPGIGRITALYLICCTANFASKISGKQLACYAGVVPFSNESGSSFKGKKRVHKMGNKELKRLLFMGAKSIITHNQEFKSYYERKLKEGKHHLSIINAVKNKMLLRAVAVIKNKRQYVDKYSKAA